MLFPPLSNATATIGTDTLCTISQFSAAHRCEEGWMCHYFGETLKPALLRCSAAAEASDWMMREWKCEADRVYLGQLRLQCKEMLCPLPPDCIVTYDLASVVYTVVACLLFLCAIAVVLMSVYYIAEISPPLIKMPYVRWVNKTAQVEFHSLNELREGNAHAHLL